MSEGSDKLDRSRQAILEYIARRQRKHDPREEPASRQAGTEANFAASSYDDDEDDPYIDGDGWFGHLRHGVRTWWRYHPAHMVGDIATPLLRTYAQRKPKQLLGLAFGAGALLTLLRPWKLISITTIIVALLKSGQISHIFTAAMSAADYRKDHNRPE
jgi:hypothetical protein